MNTESLLRKLQPLIPTKVEHWRSTRPLVDDQTRDLLDREIAATAQRILGDYWNKILLTLPPPKAANGKFQLGTIHYESPKYSAGLNKDNGSAAAEQRAQEEDDRAHDAHHDTSVWDL